MRRMLSGRLWVAPVIALVALAVSIPTFALGTGGAPRATVAKKHKKHKKHKSHKKAKRGKRGPKGLTGASGSTGATGPQGSAGASGATTAKTIQVRMSGGDADQTVATLGPFTFKTRCESGSFGGSSDRRASLVVTTSEAHSSMWSNSHDAFDDFTPTTASAELAAKPGEAVLASATFQSGGSGGTTAHHEEDQYYVGAPSGPAAVGNMIVWENVGGSSPGTGSKDCTFVFSLNRTA